MTVPVQDDVFALNCLVDECDETLYSRVGRDYHFLRDHDEQLSTDDADNRGVHGD